MTISQTDPALQNLRTALTKMEVDERNLKANRRELNNLEDSALHLSESPKRTRGLQIARINRMPDRHQAHNQPSDGVDAWPRLFLAALQQGSSSRAVRALTQAAGDAQEPDGSVSPTATAIVAAMTGRLTQRVNEAKVDDEETGLIALASLLERAQLFDAAGPEGERLLARACRAAAQSMNGYSEHSSRDGMTRVRTRDHEGNARIRIQRMDALRKVETLCAEADRRDLRIMRDPPVRETARHASELRTDWQTQEWQACMDDAVAGDYRAQLALMGTLEDQDRDPMIQAGADVLARLAEWRSPGRATVWDAMADDVANGPAEPADEHTAVANEVNFIRQAVRSLRAYEHDEHEQRDEIARRDGAARLAACVNIQLGGERYARARPYTDALMAAATGQALRHCAQHAVRSFQTTGSGEFDPEGANQSLRLYQLFVQSLPTQIIDPEHRDVVTNWAAAQRNAVDTLAGRRRAVRPAGAIGEK